jgi:C1A family cysteine protease
MLNYGKGWIPNKKDPRDHNFKRMGIHSDSIIGDNSNPDLTDHINLIRNQENTSSCTGNALAGAIDIKKDIKGVYKNPTSELFPYYFGRKLDGFHKEDVGAMPRSVAKSIVSIGICDRTTWDFDKTKINMQPDINALTEAIARKGGKYAFMDEHEKAQRPANIKAALLKGFPICFGTQITQKFEAYSRGVLTKPNSLEGYLGGHAMVIVGIYGTNYHILNSWGRSWGESGLCWIDEAYITWEESSDFCVIEGYDHISKETVKP